MAVLDVITAVFNPAGYRSRPGLYADFAARMAGTAGVRLTTVELAYQGRPFAVTEAGNPRHVQARGNDVFWAKENLINVGIAHLPADAEFVAWVDADVEFDDPDWALKTIEALRERAFVQPFDAVYDLGPDGCPLTVHRSFAAVRDEAARNLREWRDTELYGTWPPRDTPLPPVVPGSPHSGLGGGWGESSMPRYLRDLVDRAGGVSAETGAAIAAGRVLPVEGVRGQSRLQRDIRELVAAQAAQPPQQPVAESTPFSAHVELVGAARRAASTPFRARPDERVGAARLADAVAAVNVADAVAAVNEFTRTRMDEARLDRLMPPRTPGRREIDRTDGDWAAASALAAAFIRFGVEADDLEEIVADVRVNDSAEPPADGAVRPRPHSAVELNGGSFVTADGFRITTAALHGLDPAASRPPEGPPSPGSLMLEDAWHVNPSSAGVVTRETIAEAIREERAYARQVWGRRYAPSTSPVRGAATGPVRETWPHTGFAWAARRSALEATGGLFDVGVVGTGDHVMAKALLGLVHEAVPEGVAAGYLMAALSWQERARAAAGPGPALGHVPGAIRHAWHGSRRKRNYNAREAILVDRKFDPRFDLEKDALGLYSLARAYGSPRARGLRDDLRRYFATRDEDAAGGDQAIRPPDRPIAAGYTSYGGGPGVAIGHIAGLARVDLA